MTRRQPMTGRRFRTQILPATDPDGTIVGDFRATGVRPRFAGEAATLGLHFAKDAFNPQMAL